LYTCSFEAYKDLFFQEKGFVLNTGRSHPKAESYQNFPPFPAALLVQLFFRKGA